MDDPTQLTHLQPALDGEHQFANAFPGMTADKSCGQYPAIFLIRHDADKSLRLDIKDCAVSFLERQSQGFSLQACGTSVLAIDFNVGDLRVSISTPRNHQITG